VLDVLVVGAGPSGRAVAAACGERGLRTVLLDPVPDRPWRATYGAWLDELPADLPVEVVAATARAHAVARTRHDLNREYAVLDVPALRRHLDGRLAAAGARVERGRAGSSAPLAAVVIDAGGPAQPLSTKRPGRVAAEQTAAGVVLPAAMVEPLVGPGEALFMDWRPIPGAAGGPPTFLYAVPLGGDRVLVEETSLARRPGLALDVLAERLRARLIAHGIRPPADATREKVRFPLDLARHDAPGAIGFGSAAPLTHPATGFQLATSLRLAAPVAEALATGLADSPRQALRAAGTVLWPLSARITHAVRRRGLECLLRLPPTQLPTFFEGFFQLPASAQRDYLGGRTNPLRTSIAMAQVFGTTGWRLRLHLVGSSLLVSAPPDWSFDTG
jgi:lycopene beta-cyclase